MVIGDLNPIQNSLDQLTRENGSEMILSLEEEVNQDLEADSGTIVGREITSGTVVTSGTVAKHAARKALQRDQRVTCLRRSR